MKSSPVAEFGDFQTPLELARRVCLVCRRELPLPSAIIEPTCGAGSFLVAAAESFPECKQFIGRDINPDHIQAALRSVRPLGSMDVQRGDFFATDWDLEVSRLAEPILVLGNPPWVTNAELGSLQSDNAPPKSNRQGFRGIDALTGKSNFDISEWILTRLLDALDGKNATIAVLCKAAVARKVLLRAWQDGKQLASAACYGIDARKEFQVSVAACLLVCRLAPGGTSNHAEVYSKIESRRHEKSYGFCGGRLCANVEVYQRHSSLRQGFAPYRWRSGVKHDCCRVMEFVKDGDSYRNGLGEAVALEDEFLFPMLKSSQVANGSSGAERVMLVTQRRVGDPTSSIESRAPRTWRYLVDHADLLNRRRSTIFRNRPPFSIFGVGPYTFAPWKVAISGFYKRLDFSVFGPQNGKPVVLDDTSYFLACETRDEACTLHELLRSATAQEYLAALMFWDAKRPITVASLRELNLVALAAAEDVDLQRHAAGNGYCGRE